MAGNLLKAWHTHGGQEKGYHVDSNMLLALVRGQKLEDEARARQHLSVCEKCQQAYVELTQTSRMLDALGQMARYQRYPELQSGAILARAQKRMPRKSTRSSRSYTRGSTWHWVSLPVALIIMLLMTIAIVLAFTLVQFGDVPFSPGELFGKPVINVSPPAPGVVQHGITPTVIPTRGGSITPVPGKLPTLGPATVPAVTPTTTPTVPVTLSPTATMSTLPYIAVCTPPGDYAAHILDVCGYNFKPSDEVQLIVSAPAYRQPVQFQPMTVNSYGEFTYRWRIWSCRFDPVAVYAKDATSTPATYSNTLENITTAGCSIPVGTVTPTPGGH